jgi:hypothetical protein
MYKYYEMVCSWTILQKRSHHHISIASLPIFALLTVTYVAQQYESN